MSLPDFWILLGARHVTVHLIGELLSHLRQPETSVEA